MKRIYKINYKGVPDLKIVIDTEEEVLTFSGGRTKRPIVGTGTFFRAGHYNFGVCIASSNEPAVYSDGKYGYSFYVGGVDNNPKSFETTRYLKWDHYPISTIVKKFDKIFKYKLKLNKQIEVL